MIRKKRELSPWCKEVKVALSVKNMSVTELSSQVGKCRNYVSQTINGSRYSPGLAEDISKILNISAEYTI